MNVYDQKVIIMRMVSELEVLMAHTNWMIAYSRNLTDAALEFSGESMVHSIYIWSASRLFY